MLRRLLLLILYQNHRDIVHRLVCLKVKYINQLLFVLLHKVIKRTA